MSADLDQLLRAPSDGAAPGLDADALWAAGRRRRRWRQAATAGGAAVVLLGGVVLGGQITSTPVPDITPVAPQTDADPAPPPTVPQPTEPGADVRDSLPQPYDAPAPEPPAPAEVPEEEPPTPAEPAPAPPVATVDDPCAPHEGRDQEVFIDVVAPGSGQAVGRSLQLVGCANVFEANVLYRVLDASGGVVTEGFTTATCGNGCVGEFRESVDLGGATGDLTLEVFWEDAADGRERGLVRVSFSSS